MATFSFYLFCALGCAASGLYRKLTPNMCVFITGRQLHLFIYLFIHCLSPGMKVGRIHLLWVLAPSDHLRCSKIGTVHRSQGYLIILVAISLSTIDIISTARRLLNFIKSPNKSLNNLWRCIVNKEVENLKTSEYDALIPNEPENYSTAKIARDSVELDDFEQNNDMDTRETGQWTNTVHQHHRHYSINSERTMFEPHSPTHSEDTLHDNKIRQNIVSRMLRLVGHGAFAVVERSIVFAGFAQLLIGIVTYTGKAFFLRLL